MTNKARVIFHLDMNSFYASVEVTYNPKLKGKPIAVAGNPNERKGIIVISSYEARKKGVKTTMPLWEAKKLCPELIVLPPNMERYRKASKQVFSILHDITDLVEPISIDEGYMDVTNYPGNPIELAKKIQNDILNQLNLPCSIGIGPNKFLAKTASDMKKPLGITILRKRQIRELLWPLNVGEMYGIGKKTAEKLNQVNINTIGDLANADVYNLRQLLGINGERLKNRANGIDSSVVDPEAASEFQSIGNSRTLKEDTDDESEIYQWFLRLVKLVEARLVRREVMGKTIQLTLRFADRTTINRSRRLTKYTNSKEEILLVITDLFDEHWNGEPIRLIGVTVQDILNISEIHEQLSLFTYEDSIKQMNLESTVAELSKKYSKNTFKNIKKEKNDIQNEKTDLFKTSFQKDFLNDYKNKP